MQYSLTRIGEPADFITLNEAKAHLRVDFPDEDVLIASLIKSVTSVLDGKDGLCGFALSIQTWKYAFYSTCWEKEIPLNPVSTITEIKYYDVSNILQTANLSDFLLFSGQNWAKVRPIQGKAWPGIYYRPDALQISFTAGSGIIPPMIKHAALVLLSYFYENREAKTEIPQAVYSLVNQVRQGWF